MEKLPVLLSPISRADIQQVSSFLQAELNTAVSAETWAEGMQMPWLAEPPNHGFKLTIGDDVVGANLAFYSRRTIADVSYDFCNLGALCIRADQRPHALRLIRAVLAQRGFQFTDFSPSGNVPALNRRLGFEHLDTSALLVANRPKAVSQGVRLIADPHDLEGELSEAQRLVFVDHRHSAAVHHLLLRAGEESCYLQIRRDRRKGLPLFASVLYASDAALLVRHLRSVSSFLLIHLRLPFLILERRLIDGCVPPRGFSLRQNRVKMVKLRGLSPEDVDYLYSELTEIRW